MVCVFLEVVLVRKRIQVWYAGSRQFSGFVPVFCNTGCTKENVVEKLSECDGACVGTAFKKDGKFENFVEKQRVMEFMDVVKAYRCTMKEGVIDVALFFRN
mgnify:CR=1 FL=1